jgi:Carboxypeptidase regulatory-like domain
VHRAFTFAICVLAGLRAQSTNAGLSGRITDPSQAVIFAARVAAISAGTNLHYEAAASGTGEYHLANLPPGPCRIEVDKPGFKKLIKPDVILHVQDALEIDFEMTLGSNSEAINAGGGATLVNTETGTASTVIDRAFVESLPLNGRSFQTLIVLTPGVVVTVASALDPVGIEASVLNKLPPEIGCLGTIIFRHFQINQVLRISEGWKKARFGSWQWITTPFFARGSHF